MLAIDRFLEMLAAEKGMARSTYLSRYPKLFHNSKAFGFLLSRKKALFSKAVL